MIRKTVFLAAALLPALLGTPRDVAFSQPDTSVEAYDFVEVTASVAGPDAHNPFTDAALHGSFAKTGSAERTKVEGFCDSPDGSVFRIRFMPSSPGDYTYEITYRQGAFEKTYAGSFRASDGHRRGPVRVDSKYPWHFIWEGTGEH